MPGKAIKKETIRKNTIEDMKTLGIYKPEYNAVIDIYAEMREQYERITKEFIERGYPYATETIQGGEKKSALVSTLETLRKDILQYTDRLCLNPKAAQQEKGDKKKKGKSKLEEALKSLG